MQLKTISTTILVWAYLITIVSIVSWLVIPLSSRFTDLKPSPEMNHVWIQWSNFDGLHYLDIAKYGYGSAYTDKSYAFFPTYPYLLRLVSGQRPTAIVGILVSIFSLIFALYFLFKLLRLDFSEKISRNTILLMLVFPVSFFFGSVYTESLFLLLSVLVFYLARKQRFFLASAIAMLASATKITGIFLYPALVYEWFTSKRRSFTSFIHVVALPPIGLFSYTYYQWIKTGDPLYFVHSQSNFSGRSVEKLILLPQVFYRYLKIIIGINKFDPIYFTALLEFATACFVVCMLIFGIKKLRLSYYIYLIPAFILPTLTGTFLSMPRFVLVMFPLFALLSSILVRLPNYAKILYIVLSVLVSILSISLFVRGHFVG